MFWDEKLTKLGQIQSYQVSFNQLPGHAFFSNTYVLERKSKKFETDSK